MGFHNSILILCAACGKACATSHGCSYREHRWASHQAIPKLWACYCKPCFDQRAAEASQVSAELSGNVRTRP